LRDLAAFCDPAYFSDPATVCDSAVIRDRQLTFDGCGRPGRTATTFTNRQINR